MRKELVRPERSILPGDDAFRFRHILIRDAAYDALPNVTRADLHAAANLLGRAVDLTRDGRERARAFIDAQPVAKR